eukprot:6799271-Prymnesium_polylepis.1
MPGGWRGGRSSLMRGALVERGMRVHVWRIAGRRAVAAVSQGQREGHAVRRSTVRSYARRRKHKDTQTGT